MIPVPQFGKYFGVSVGGDLGEEKGTAVASCGGVIEWGDLLRPDNPDPNHTRAGQDACDAPIDVLVRQPHLPCDTPIAHILTSACTENPGTHFF